MNCRNSLNFNDHTEENTVTVERNCFQTSRTLTQIMLAVSSIWLYRQTLTTTHLPHSHDTDYIISHTVHSIHTSQPEIWTVLSHARWHCSHSMCDGGRNYIITEEISRRKCEQQDTSTIRGWWRWQHKTASGLWSVPMAATRHESMLKYHTETLQNCPSTNCKCCLLRSICKWLQVKQTDINVTPGTYHRPWAQRTAECQVITGETDRY